MHRRRCRPCRLAESAVVPCEQTVPASQGTRSQFPAVPRRGHYPAAWCQGQLELSPHGLPSANARDALVFRVVDSVLSLRGILISNYMRCCSCSPVRKSAQSAPGVGCSKGRQVSVGRAASQTWSLSDTRGMRHPLLATTQSQLSSADRRPVEVAGASDAGGGP